MHRLIEIFIHHTKAACVVATLALSMGACGGADTKTGSNGTGVAPPVEEDLASSGPITGLGGETVAGLGLQAAAAQVVIDANGNRSLNDLRLGMPAEVRGRIVGNANAATATVINAQSLVSGPLLAIDVGSGRLTLPGVEVDVDSNTIFDGTGPLTALTPGRAVEVYALTRANTSGAAPWLATRVVASSRPANEISLLGTVNAIGNGTITLGNLTVTNATAAVIGSPVSASPAPPVIVSLNGTVRVIGTYSAATNSIVATSVVTGLTPQRLDNSVLALDGIVQSVTGPGQFRLLDTEVRSAAAANVQPGLRVRVRGPKRNGILEANELTVQPNGAPVEYMLTGEITRVDSAGAIAVRGETVMTLGARLNNGSAADLVAGRRVRILVGVVAGNLVARDIAFL